LSVITSTRGLVFVDPVADLDMPGDDLGLGGAFADIGQLEDVAPMLSPPSPGASRRRRAAVPGKYCHSKRVRIGRVPPGHAHDRRFEMIEAVLLHQRRQLGAEAAGARRLVHDHAAPGLLDRRDDGLDVERQQRAQIDHFGVDAGFLGRASATCTIVP
jgi:hypothetical protein